MDFFISAEQAELAIWGRRRFTRAAEVDGEDESDDETTARDEVAYERQFDGPR